jgi:hypothetical protein
VYRHLAGFGDLLSAAVLPITLTIRPENIDSFTSPSRQRERQRMQTYTVTVQSIYAVDALPVKASVMAVDRDDALRQLCPEFENMPASATVAIVSTTIHGQQTFWRKWPGKDWSAPWV